MEGDLDEGLEKRRDNVSGNRRLWHNEKKAGIRQHSVVSMEESDFPCEFTNRAYRLTGVFIIRESRLFHEMFTGESFWRWGVILPIFKSKHLSLKGQLFS